MPWTFVGAFWLLFLGARSDAFFFGKSLLLFEDGNILENMEVLETMKHPLNP